MPNSGQAPRKPVTPPWSVKRAARAARATNTPPPTTRKQTGSGVITPPKALREQASAIRAQRAPTQRAAPSDAPRVITPPKALQAVRQQAAEVKPTPNPTVAAGGIISPPKGLRQGVLDRQKQEAPEAEKANATPLVESGASNDADDFDGGGWEDNGGWEDGGGWDDGDDWASEEQKSPSRLFPRVNAANIHDRDTSTVDISRLDSVRGRVVELKKYNEWGRAKLIPEGGGSSLTITGAALMQLENNDSVILHGNHKTHHTYGPQFEVEISTPDSTSVPALIRHLMKNFKGVGQKGAGDIVTYYQDKGQIEQLRKLLIYSPSSLDFTPITGRAAELIDDDNTKQSRINTLISLQYNALGIRATALTNLGRKLCKHIDGMTAPDLARLISDIEDTTAKSAPVKKADGESIAKREITKVLGTPEPTLTDEQYAAQLLAEYEQMMGLSQSGYVPRSVAVKASRPHPLTVPNLDGEEQLIGEDWQAHEVRKANSATVDHVHAARVILADDPYQWIGKVEGYTFRTADLIARHEGVKRDDPRRLQALVAFSLEYACVQEGHTYVDLALLQHTIKGVDPDVDGAVAINEALARRLIEQEGDRYYPRGFLKNERELAHHIASRISFPIEPLIGHNANVAALDALLDAAEENVGEKKGITHFKLDLTQRAAVKGILTSESSLHVIEGGPGRGKTAIVQVLMEALKCMDRLPESSFCAPVGKAAKVLNSQISEYGAAQTIHSLLGARGTGFEFSVNEENPLDSKLVVADEQSMTSLALGAGLFNAIPSRSHIIMLGDTNQLLPIDSGNVMKSIVALDNVDKHMLTVTHRNQGKILELVDQVNEGRWPITNEEMAAIESAGDVKLHNDPTVLAETRISDFIDRVESATKEYGGAEHIGVICPIRRGNINKPAWNVTYLNHALRERLNPDPRREKAILGSAYRLNDRIILTKNMRVIEYGEGAVSDEIESALGAAEDAPKVRVANGDTGYLTKAIVANVDGTRKAIGYVMDLDDGRRVLIGDEEKENMGLAYAITVHAAQGSEYQKVFGVIQNGHASFMHRALMMTMLSRAKESLEVFGTTRDCSVVASRLPPHRNCAILERSEELITRFEQAKAKDDVSNHNAYMPMAQAM